MTSHPLRARANISDIRQVYGTQTSWDSETSDTQRPYIGRQNNGHPSAHGGASSKSTIRRPQIHQHQSHDDATEGTPRFIEGQPLQASPSSSVETYASTVPSQLDLVEESPPKLQAPAYTMAPCRLDAIPATPSQFSQLFPSHRRLDIHHDDSTSDGNMNLRIDTEAQLSSSLTTLMTLFHLRMHDLKRREFSLRRYCRDSGREVCRTTPAPKDAKPVSERRAGLRRSLSNAFNGMRGNKPESRPAHDAHLKRNDSGYGSMRSVDMENAFDDDDEDKDERTSSSHHVPALNTHAFDSIKLEFSNYAQVEMRRCGAGSSKRYEFEYWGTHYAWRRTVRKDGAFGEIASFHLTSNGNEHGLAYMMPISMSVAEAREESENGGWIAPYSMWIADDHIIESQKDTSDVIVATGIIALADHFIREHFEQGKRPRSLSTRFVEEVLRRERGGDGSRERPSSSRRPSSSGSGVLGRWHSNAVSSNRPTSVRR